MKPPSSFVTDRFFSGGLHLAQQVVEAQKRGFPELAVMLQPRRGLRERFRLELARPPLRVAAGGNESGALQHLEVFGDGRLAHRKRFGQFRYRGGAGSEARKDRAPRGVGEGGKGGVEAGGAHSWKTILLNNQKVI